VFLLYSHSSVQQHQQQSANDYTQYPINLHIRHYLKRRSIFLRLSHLPGLIHYNMQIQTRPLTPSWKKHINVSMSECCVVIFLVFSSSATFTVRTRQFIQSEHCGLPRSYTTTLTCGLGIFAGLLSTFRDSNIHVKYCQLSVVWLVYWLIKHVLCSVLIAISVLLRTKTCDDLEIRISDAWRLLKVIPVNSSFLISHCNGERNSHRFRDIAFDRSRMALFCYPLAFNARQRCSCGSRNILPASQQYLMYKMCRNIAERYSLIGPATLYFATTCV